MHIRIAGLPAPMREHRFHPKRQWRFDFAWPAIRLAVEVEGVTHNSGRHQRFEGYSKDCEKYNNAALLGWRVLRYTTEQVKKGYALEQIENAIGQGAGKLMGSGH